MHIDIDSGFGSLVADGSVKVKSGKEISYIEGKRLVLSDTTALEADAIIFAYVACSGFSGKSKLCFQFYLELDTNQQGMPTRLFLAIRFLVKSHMNGG